MPAQVLSTSLDNSSKLRGPSPKALVQLNSATLILTQSLELYGVAWRAQSRYVSFVGEFSNITKHFIKGCVRTKILEKIFTTFQELDSRWRRFVEWAPNEIAVVPDFHKRILFSDEAHFWLNGYVNKQNCRIWSEANPQVYVETPLHPEKLTVWCALWAGGILLHKR
ncbi:hypothetical protein TNCV_3143271 [Trichonephila clavipes]|nr:hypothetical protein TNCV_3143271 [Trichonephila clavipes]